IALRFSLPRRRRRLAQWFHLVFGGRRFFFRLAELTADAAQEIIDTPRQRTRLQYCEHEDGAQDADDVKLDSDGHADGCRRPDGSGGRDPAHGVTFAEDDAGADEADAGHDLRGYA